jgi:hypothetical protein
MRSTNTCSKNVEDRWDKSDCPQVILNGAQPQYCSNSEVTASTLPRLTSDEQTFRYAS